MKKKKYLKPVIEVVTEDDLKMFEAEALSCKFCNPICTICGIH